MTNTEYIDLFNIGQNIMDSAKLSWEAKYHAIFDASMSGKMFNYKHFPDYCDPDMDYDDDVCAFWRAATEAADIARELIACGQE